MTSVLSTVNPLYEKFQTLTRSIYTKFDSSVQETEATAIVDPDRDTVLTFDENTGDLVVKRNVDADTNLMSFSPTDLTARIPAIDSDIITSHTNNDEIEDNPNNVTTVRYITTNYPTTTKVRQMIEDSAAGGVNLDDSTIVNTKILTGPDPDYKYIEVLNRNPMELPLTIYGHDQLFTFEENGIWRAYLFPNYDHKFNISSTRLTEDLTYEHLNVEDTLLSFNVMMFMTVYLMTEWGTGNLAIRLIGESDDSLQPVYYNVLPLDADHVEVLDDDFEYRGDEGRLVLLKFDPVLLPKGVFEFTDDLVDGTYQRNACGNMYLEMQILDTTGIIPNSNFYETGFMISDPDIDPPDEYEDDYESWVTLNNCLTASKVNDADMHMNLEQYTEMIASNKITEVQNSLESRITTLSNNITANLATKANAADVYDKTTIDTALATKLGVNDNAVSATKAGQIEYTADSITYSLKPNDTALSFYNGNTEKLRINNSGNLYCKNLYPNNITFGNTTVGQTSGKWIGVITNIVNTTNKTTADSKSDADKDTYIPSYRVLQDNYALKTDIPTVGTTWNWTNGANAYVFGTTNNYVQMTENGTVVNKITPAGMYTEVVSPESMIQFGKAVNGGNVSGRWLSQMVGVANDNYDATTYSSVNTDNIVPSLKYINNRVLIASITPTITATFPSSELTASNSYVSNWTVGNNLIPISTNTIANCSVSVSVSSGVLSTLRVGLVLVPSSGNNLEQMLTNNGDGTFTLSNFSFSTDTTKTYSVKLNYQRYGGSSNVKFTFDSCSLSFYSQTTFDNYYPKSYVDALEARIAALENANS